MRLDGYLYKNVRSVPAHIKLAVFEDAIRREVTMGDVIGEILAKRFSTPYELSGEKSIGADLEGDQFRIQIPEEMTEAIWKHSRTLGETESSVVLEAIADHFRLEFVPVRKGRKRAAA